MNNLYLLQGLFLTTGMVLGILCHPTNSDGEDLIFALLSVAVFYGLFYLAQRRHFNYVAAYFVAGVVWSGLYLLFEAL